MVHKTTAFCYNQGMFKTNQSKFSTSPLHRRRILYFLFFVVVFAYFLWLNNTLVFPDPDSFYHAKITELTGDFGPVKDFPWLPFTTLNDIYIDHHFLYHLILVPFVYFFDPLLVIKIAAVFFAALAIILFQWLLDRLAIKYSFVYTLILLFSDKFIFRINLAKVPSLSLIVILLVLYYLFINKGRWSWPLFGLAFLYIWLYGGWPILLGIGLIYFIIIGASNWLEEVRVQRTRNQKSEIRNISREFKSLIRKLFSWESFQLPLNIFSGLLAGLIISPYFPRNLQFYWQQTFQIGLVNYRGLVDVGGEWYPLNFMDL
ncbi:MAG TPA: hypothetical protein P5267_00170, partial [Patescibacteria group bacterium]|nr:hypothetical protein [Patescibacteria group bacterium]